MEQGFPGPADPEWEMIKRRFRRRWLGVPVMRIADEGGSPYFREQPGLSLLGRFMSRFIW